MKEHDPFADKEVFENETFTDLDLQDYTIADKDFYRCSFRNAKLGMTRWPSVTMEGCVFDDCDLVRMVPTRMALRGVEFRRCRLMGVDWSNAARNPEVTFVDCNLRYASFVGTNLRKTEFTRCALTDGNFIDVELNEAVVESCDLSGTTFSRCDLSKADFSTASGLLIDPTKNRVKGLIIPVDAAVALALIAGMKVAGY